MRLRAVALSLVAAVAGSLLVGAPSYAAPVGASAVASAPAMTPAGAVTAPGPRLSVTRAEMHEALTCSGPLRGVRRDPVLLTPAFSTGAQSYAAGYARQLPRVGITTCTLSLPDGGFGDLQRAAEYDVLAVRWMAARSGRRVALVAHQHGALDGLWAMTFWPDVARRVSDFVSLATPFQGTSGTQALCADGLRACPPALWQISTGSSFLGALTADPLPRGASYTSIATAYDVLITPQPRASRLRGARNITLQDLCPGRPIEHFTTLVDNLSYRLVLDALAHPGPADPDRLPAAICDGPLYLPGVSDPGPLLTLGAGGLGALLNAALQGPVRIVGAEPRLRAYAR